MTAIHVPAHTPAAQAVPRQRRIATWLATALTLVVVLAAGWWAFAPPQLGGKTSFLVTDGVSMLPRFHAGDLVVLRAEPSYHVGEIAGYHNAQLGNAIVMHRIIAIHHGHYEFKGDNNSFVDSFQPTKAGIVGAEIVHLPGAGRYLLTLHRPIVAAVIIFLLALFSFSTPTPPEHRPHHFGKRAT